jgi:hypothetical protein
VIDTYTEISPSQTGAKMFFLVELADVRWFLDLIEVEADKLGTRRGIPGEDPRNHGAAIEVYLGFRYFAVTGRSFTDEPHDIALLDRGALERLAKLIPPARGPGTPKDRSQIAFRRASNSAAGTPAAALPIWSRPCAKIPTPTSAPGSRKKAKSPISAS